MPALFRRSPPLRFQFWCLLSGLQNLYQVSAFRDRSAARQPAGEFLRIACCESTQAMVACKTFQRSAGFQQRSRLDSSFCLNSLFIVVASTFITIFTRPLRPVRQLSQPKRQKTNIPHCIYPVVNCQLRT